jgi:uncharacterized protein
MTPSLIITLTTVNASPDRVPKLLAWVRDLYGRGMKSLRLHFLEVDHDAVDRHLMLPQKDLQGVLEAFMELQADPAMHGIDIDLFKEIIAMQRGHGDDVTCVWHACDPFTTTAVKAVDPDGTQVNCGRVEKLGVPWRKADTVSHERQLALYHLPQEDGGCKGCPFFVMCTGYCPGTAINGDWRLRTVHCETLKWLFTKMERLLLFMGETPTSRRPDLARIEEQTLELWKKGSYASLDGVVHGQWKNGRKGHGDSHGDHTDVKRILPTVHGDKHGDHTDSKRG